jgi:hypothetical protein
VTQSVTSADFRRQRRAKNIAVGLAVVAVCILFYIITIVRLGGH